MTKQEYKEYLSSDHWKRIKMRRSGNKHDKMKCQICKSNKNINLHHKTYKRLWNERMSDLVWLCQKCHKLVHDKTRFNKEITILDIKFDMLLEPSDKTLPKIKTGSINRGHINTPPVIGSNGSPLHGSNFSFYKQRKKLSVENPKQP